MLTPFIDLAFAHFMFSVQKMPEFFNVRDSLPTEMSNLEPNWIILSRFAPISLLMGHL